MPHTHQTDPIPVFPTEGATVPGTRTPMALELIEATSKAPIRHSSPLPDDVVKEIAASMVADFLDSYATNLERAAMDVAVADEPCGLLAIWHGADYAIAASDDVAPGYLVEQRCYCQSTRRPAHQRPNAELN